MKKIEKGTAPVHLGNKNCENHLETIITNRKKVKTKPKLAKKKHSVYWYRGNKNSPASPFYQLRSLYKYNCAFCERYGDNFSVDHYRPKDSVLGTDHPGYYWLGYEWTNLIYVCGDCNEGHKGSKFPVELIHVDDSSFKNISGITDQVKLFSELNLLEKPLLLNPEEKDFNPLKYIEFDKNGFPSPVKDSKRAKQTIADCGIDRPDLNDKRNEVIENLGEKISLAVFISWGKYKNRSDSKEAISRVLEVLKDDNPKEFSLLWKYIYLNFDSIVAQKVLTKKENKNLRSVLFDAFKTALADKIKKEPPLFQLP
ncbi:MAG: hypothetical protein HYZ14_15530 [Bacteroidetes bacterium]|nr:hypothetical protein [Bacteroidota bacterium]